MERDLSIGKHPLLMGRHWPTKLHHWKATELEVFLEQHNYPRHTHRDQLEARRRACVEALLKKDRVPAEVLAEDPEILMDVEMHRLADVAWLEFGKKLDAKKAEFEGAIGFLTSDEAYMQTMQSLIEHAVKHRQTAGYHQMVTTWNDWHLSLQIDEGRPRSRGHFGAYGGRTKKLNIFLGENRFGISCIHSLEWKYVDQMLNNIWLKDRSSIEDIWFLTGTGWAPSQAAIIQYRDSLQLSAA